MEEDWWNPLPDQTPGGIHPFLPGALASVGMALGQPAAWGQNPFAQVLSSLGAGGESVRGQEEQARKERASRSQEELRAAQAEAASSRAATSEARSNTAAANLALRERDIERKTEANRLGNIIRAQGAYNAAVGRAIQENQARAKRNSDVMRDPSMPIEPMLPVPSYQEWLAQNPQILDTLRATGAVVPTTPAGGKTPASETTTPDYGIGAGTTEAADAAELDRARAAIAAGAPKEKVIQRLREKGVDPARL